ncbi:hypothetical protein GBAR_LOCUS9414 [Geodia barretti]|uniref:Uncharacterized protein n=1 Tax=Geodia barretti TaxID=519541 RepID=A0AA35RP31_GEOBA|nr:hypothetical protein GBAR_LOCUS9414 [Geodia barretti]
MLLLCQCQPQLSQGEFSCRTGPPNTVTYRARITGTSSRSATEVVAIMGAWVQTNKGSVQIDRLRYYLDPTCDPTLENIHGPDCPVAETPTDGKLAYFQVRIQTSNANCEQWVAEDTEGKLSQIQKSLQQSMLLLCQCQPQLSQGEFSCRTGPPNTVTYRARITGTSSRSATEMVAIMGAWVQTNKGSVQIDRLRYYLDPTCDPTLENIHGPDCQVAQTPTDGTTVTTGGSTVTTDNTTTHETTNKPVTSDTSKPSTEDSTTQPITPPTKPGIDPKDPQI